MSKPRSSNSFNKLGSSFQQSTHKMFWPDQYSYFRHVLNMFSTYFFIISIYNWSDLQSTHKMFWSIHIFQTCLVYNSWLSQKQSTSFGLFQQMFWLILIYLSNTKCTFHECLDLLQQGIFIVSNEFTISQYLDIDHSLIFSRHIGQQRNLKYIQIESMANG